MPQDPELKAVSTIMRTLEPLQSDAQRRVMSYVAERLRAHVSFDIGELMTALTEAMSAISGAARELDITGAQLMGVVLAMYDEAKESNANNEAGDPDQEVQSPGEPELQSPATPTV